MSIFLTNRSFTKVALTAVLDCVLIVIVPVVMVAGASAQQSADSSASPQTPADSLNVIDHLIEQNQQLERQNRQLEQQNQQLMEQIKAVRGAVAQTANQHAGESGSA